MQRRRFLLPLVLVLLVIAAACAQVGVVVDEDGFVNAHLLVDAEWLADNLDDEQLVIIDIRSSQDAYVEGHIPGAVWLSRSTFSDPDAEYEGILTHAEFFEDLMRDAGVNDDSIVVLYDEQTGIWAARVFYGLEFYGHFDNVRILNGGFAAWEAAELSVSDEPPVVARGNFTAEPQPDLQFSADELAQRLDDDGLIIFDVRSEAEYLGDVVRSDQGGHIPGAVFLEWTEVLDEDGRWLSAEAVEALYAQIGLDPDKLIVPYCQTNVRGAHSYFTLRLLDYDVRPYEGSWAEWGNREDLPAHTAEDLPALPS